MPKASKGPRRYKPTSRAPAGYVWKLVKIRNTGYRKFGLPEPLPRAFHEERLKRELAERAAKAEADAAPPLDDRANPLLSWIGRAG